MMFPLQRCCLLLFALFVAARAEAQLAVEVTRGSTQAIPVAVVPFADTALAGGTDPAAVVAADLDRQARAQWDFLSFVIYTAIGISAVAAVGLSLLIGRSIDEATAEEAGAASVASALPMSNNAHKVQLAKVAVKRAILLAAGLNPGGL